MTKQQQVIEYLDADKSLYTDLVFFPKLEEEEIKPLKEMKLPELVKKILSLSENHYSSRVDEVVETGPDRRRSSIDIWRHIKHFQPKITIFEVMSAICELEDELEGNLCSVVDRRVFHSQWDDDDGPFIYDQEDLDEFGLLFWNWEDIHLEPQ